MKSNISNINDVCTSFLQSPLKGVRNAIPSNQTEYKPDTLIKMLEGMYSLYSFCFLFHIFTTTGDLYACK